MSVEEATARGPDWGTRQAQPFGDHPEMKVHEGAARARDRFRAGIAWSSVGSSRPARQAVGRRWSYNRLSITSAANRPFPASNSVISARIQMLEPNVSVPDALDEPDGPASGRDSGERS